MQAELNALRAKGPASGGPVRNPVFQRQQRVGTAVDATEATDVAARAVGEMAAQADQERLAIEAQVAGIERSAPGTPQARDAEAAVSLAEHDADEAVAKSLDAGAADEDARASEGTRFLHRSADPERAEADEHRALDDESVAGRDLADIDGLEARVAHDAEGARPSTD